MSLLLFLLCFRCVVGLVVIISVGFAVVFVLFSLRYRCGGCFPYVVCFCLLLFRCDVDVVAVFPLGGGVVLCFAFAASSVCWQLFSMEFAVAFASLSLRRRCGGRFSCKEFC